jgi:hypothetical protein
VRDGVFYGDVMLDLILLKGGKFWGLAPQFSLISVDKWFLFLPEL